jgi:hypothetical protein
MDGWMDELIVWKNEGMDGWIVGGWVDGWMDKLIGWKNEGMDGWMN